MGASLTANCGDKCAKCAIDAPHDTVATTDSPPGDAGTDTPIADARADAVIIL